MCIIWCGIVSIEMLMKTAGKYLSIIHTVGISQTSIHTKQYEEHNDRKF